jgi:hypothetical protein
MGLPTDVLSKATPTRLICRGGRWLLELTRLEAVDRDVFRPSLTRLEGADSILAALRKGEDGQHLATGAAQIMRSSRAEEDRAFEVNDGDWIPSSDASVPLEPAPTDQGTNDNARAIAELRAELLVLRASHARLRERVMTLEAAQSGLSHPNPRPPRGRNARRRSEPPPAPFSPAPATAEPHPKNVAFDATQASPGIAPAAAPAAAPAQQKNGGTPPASDDESSAPAQTFDELARAIAGDQRPAPLSPPTLVSVNECLSTLIGAPAQLERGDATPFEKLDRARICMLLDDEGRERGAVILDLKAALLLGAGLLGLPRGEALRQIKENDPSEDALLAVSEICNNLTGPVNIVAGNDHVRSTALANLDPTRLPPARARLDLTFEGGHVILAMF